MQEGPPEEDSAMHLLKLTRRRLAPGFSGVAALLIVVVLAFGGALAYL